jgi:ubiquinone/menaquinone biosynthesis C-methylase UbiE
VFHRTLTFTFVVTCLTFSSAGCKKSAPHPSTEACEIVLLLPDTSDTSGYRDRITKLKIDNKEIEEKPARKRTVKVDVEKSKDTVTIVYSYWPRTYTNRIRSKVVKVDKTKAVEADLRKEDPANPDKIEPIFYPTPHSLLKPMCDLGKVGKDDVVYDIGCGDGRLVIAAVKDFGAKKGVGIDINEKLIEECKANAKKAGVADKCEFRVEDATNIKDLSEATVVMIYLGEDLNMKIRPVLQTTLKPGARIVSHRFLMGDWEPDKTVELKSKRDEGDFDDYRLHLWAITNKKPPAKKTEILLLLPETADTTGYSDRNTTLKIDGKNIKEIPKRKRILEVKPKEGKDTVTIVYSYWPKSYTNRIRTKVAKVDKDKRVTVDITKEDPANPDKIFPIYYPTPHSLMKPMCEMAKVGKNDVVYDIGCGDGRLVIAAVKDFGAKKGVGIDINAKLIEECKENAKKAGVADKCEFRVEDATKIKDFSEASVVMLYLGEDLNMKIRPVLQKTLKPGSRIVSHRFDMGDWKTDKTTTFKAKRDEGDEDEYTLHLWTIKEKPKSESRLPMRWDWRAEGVSPRWNLIARWNPFPPRAYAAGSPQFVSFTGDKEPKKSELYLWLPQTSDTSEYEDRITTLKIDGKLQKEVPARKRTFQVLPAKGKNSVTVVYSYWPKSYTNRIRTKVVTVEPGKKLVVDIRKEDPNNPDKIFPIYYPTPHSLMKPMCELAKVGKDDIVYDIGCGDGRLVIAAVKQFGAKKGVGIDINEKLIKECIENAKKAGVADKCEFRVQDALKIKDFSEATVVMLYMGEDLNLKIRPILKKTLKPGARIVSHRFLMGDWKTDTTLNITAKRDEGDEDEYALHLWTIKNKKEK